MDGKNLKDNVAGTTLSNEGDANNPKISCASESSGIVVRIGHRFRLVANGYGMAVLVIFILCATGVLITNGYPVT